MPQGCEVRECPPACSGYIVRRRFRISSPRSKVTRQRTLLSIAAALLVLTLDAASPGGQESSTALSPQALQQIAEVEAEIDRIEAQTLERLATPPDNQVQQVE